MCTSLFPPCPTGIGPRFSSDKYWSSVEEEAWFCLTVSEVSARSLGPHCFKEMPRQTLHREGHGRGQHLLTEARSLSDGGGQGQETPDRDTPAGNVVWPAFHSSVSG